PQAGEADVAGRSAAPLPGESRARAAPRPGAGDPRLAAARGASDRRRDAPRERRPRRHAVRPGGDERVDERAAADGAADHGRGERPRCRTDQDDTLAPHTLEIYG